MIVKTCPLQNECDVQNYLIETGDNMTQRNANIYITIYT